LFLSHLRKDIVVERLMTETPSARLTAPKGFPDKRDFLAAIDDYMEEHGLSQGSELS